MLWHVHSPYNTSLYLWFPINTLTFSVCVRAFVPHILPGRRIRSYNYYCTYAVAQAPAIYNRRVYRCNCVTSVRLSWIDDEEMVNEKNASVKTSVEIRFVLFCVGQFSVANTMGKKVARDGTCDRFVLEERTWKTL